MTWLASQGKLEQLEQLYQQIDTAAHSWLTRIKAVLALGHGVKIHSSDGTQVPLVVHTVACVSQHLLLALVKCALYQLSQTYPLAGMLLRSQARKNKLFKRIVHRFSPRATYVVVGRGEEERTASRVVRAPHETSLPQCCHALLTHTHTHTHTRTRTWHSSTTCHTSTFEHWTTSLACTSSSPTS